MHIFVLQKRLKYPNAMKVIIDRDIPFVGGLLEPYAEVLYQRGELIDARAAADCDAMLIRTRTRCDAALLDSSRVRFIATATIGYDHILSLIHI